MEPEDGTLIPRMYSKVDTVEAMPFKERGGEDGLVAMTSGWRWKSATVQRTMDNSMFISRCQL